MVLYKEPRTFRFIALIFLLLNSVDGHNPSNSLFGKPATVHKTNFLAPELFYLSALRKINFDTFFLNVKSHLSGAVIGMVIASCISNRVRIEPTNTSITNTSITNTTASNDVDKGKGSVMLSNDDDTVSELTKHKLNIHPDVITNVCVKMRVQVVETELELAVCNCSYVAINSHEINIEKGEVVTVYHKPGSVWCNGVNSKGEWGIFPAKNILFINKNKIKRKIKVINKKVNNS